MIIVVIRDHLCIHNHRGMVVVASKRYALEDGQGASVAPLPSGVPHLRDYPVG